MEQIVITATRDDIDNVVFSAAQEVAESQTHLSLRERLKFALSVADRIMAGIDDLGGASKRSEAAKKAAAARYSKPKPTPGPAIPHPPAQTNAGQVVHPPAPPVPPTLPPPPHPALMPQGMLPGTPAAPPPPPSPFGPPPA